MKRAGKMKPLFESLYLNLLQRFKTKTSQNFSRAYMLLPLQQSEQIIATSVYSYDREPEVKEKHASIMLLLARALAPQYKPLLAN
jgi:hypothetical protein